MATDFITDLAVHPGEFLREELEARELTQAELARQMDRPAELVNAICRERKNITAATALDLEKALDIRASTWMNLQTQYELTIERNRRAKQEAATLSSA
ncbi:MAG TPA: HigA family addiction module antitoxin [Dehalococcoidia bacterium]|nr:HigA family addiction module antitoxin [Dehalococcoidia bacterium]